MTREVHHVNHLIAARQSRPH